MRIRDFHIDDYDAVSKLWMECGLQPSRSDRREAIVHKLERDPDLFLVVEDNGRVVGSVMGTYDGRRGWINRLCVKPASRKRSLGKILVQELEARLRLKGCEKVNLLIEPDNTSVAEFYGKLGYTADALLFMEKWIVPA